MKHKFRFLFWILSLSAFWLSCGGGAVSQQQEAEVDAGSDEVIQLLPAQDLSQWDGDFSYWTLEEGKLIGQTTSSTPELKANTFLILKQSLPGDFEFVTSFKISAEGNSGINYRSDKVEGVPYALAGYQADIDGANAYTGQNYEERKRTTLAYRGEVARILAEANGKVERNAWTGRTVERALGEGDALKDLIKDQDWNECRIVAKGNRLSHYINGELMSEVIDEDPEHRKLDGFLGIQIHVGPPMRVEYKDMTIKPL